jgi:uncharacterized protein YaaQ
MILREYKMSKKMVLAILEDVVSSPVVESLSKAGYQATLIDSTGGFLSQGASTLIVAADEKDVDRVITIINIECTPSANPFQKRATIMVLGVDHFEQIP